MQEVPIRIVLERFANKPSTIGVGIGPAVNDISEVDQQAITEIAQTDCR